MTPAAYFAPVPPAEVSVVVAVGSTPYCESFQPATFAMASTMTAGAATVS